MPLPDASFDLAVSEYGASIWADPYLWIPEAARLLRPGGQLVFLVNGTLVDLCARRTRTSRPGRRLVRDYFGMHRFEWPDDQSRRLPPRLRRLDPAPARRTGFEVEHLVELQAPEGAQQHRYETLPGPDVGAAVAVRGDLARRASAR